MKKKIFLRLAAGALLAALLCLTGCGETDGQDVQDDTEPLVEALDDADAMKLEGFTIVRPDIAGKDAIDAAIALRNAVNETCGSNIAITTDWVKRGTTPPTDTPELCVGTTNRREADVTLRLHDYQIIREGNRVYLTGGSEAAAAEAVNYVIEHLLSPAGLLIPDGTAQTVRGTYEIASFAIGGKTPFAVTYSVDNTASAFAEEAGGLITEKTGLPTGLDAKEADIRFVSSHKDIPNGSWGLTCRDGVLYVVGSTELEVQKSAKYLLNLLRETKNELSFEEGVLVSEHQTTREEYLEVERLVIYPEFPKEINRDYDYTVTVTQGKTTERIPVYNHSMQNSVKSRAIGGDLYRRFSTFAFSGGQVRVDIRVNRDFKTYTVAPSAKNFKTEFKDGVISVYLDKPDYFLIRLDDDLNSILSVFADEPEFPEELPDKDDPNVTWVEGWVEPEGGVFRNSDKNHILYIAPGSVMNARVLLNGEHSKVIGHGAIVDPFEDIYEYDITAGGTEGKGLKLLTISGTDMMIDGPILLDARCFNIAVSGTRPIIRNTKCLSSMMTSDGISIYSGKDALIEHCFVYVGDNVMVFSAENTVYRDITAGTTCSALFPQGNPMNTLLEDIHIFRIGEGMIHNTYNGSNDQLTADVTVRNMDSIDSPYIPYLFLGRNMGTLDKVYHLSNITMPLPIGTADPHKTTTPYIFRFQNSSNYLETSNYKIDVTNLYVDGKRINTVSDMEVEGAQYENTLTVAADDSYQPPQLNVHTVNYTAPDKVFIGLRQLSFVNPPVRDGAELLLPADEIRAYLRTDKSASAVAKNGVSYVKAGELVKSGMAADMKTQDDGSIVLTPVYNGENLLLPDSGEISQFTESTCYELDLVTSRDPSDGGIIYSVKTIDTINAGVTRFITNEVYMYGAGKYKLTFRARSTPDGELNVHYEDETTNLSTPIRVTSEWKEYSYTFEVKADKLSSPMHAFYINGRVLKLEQFDLRDFSLTKIS